MSSNNKILTESTKKRNYKKYVIFIIIGIMVVFTYHVITIVTDPDYGCDGGRKISDNGNLFNHSIICTSNAINVMPDVSKQIIDQYDSTDKLEFTFGEGINGICVEVTHSSLKGTSWDKYEHSCKVFVRPNSKILSQGEPIPAVIFENVNWVTMLKTFRADGSLAYNKIDVVPVDYMTVFLKDEIISVNPLEKCNIKVHNGYVCPNPEVIEFYGIPDKQGNVLR